MALMRSTLSRVSILGIVALLPFIVGGYYSYQHSSLAALAVFEWLIPYLAIVIGFIGGIQWGRILANGRAGMQGLVLAVIPPLAACGALFLSVFWASLLLMGALLFAWLVDEHGFRCGWQSRGFLRLRRLLTLVVAVAWVLIWIRAYHG